MAKATASTKSTAIAKASKAKESNLRGNVIAYLTARMTTLRGQLMQLETVIGDSGSEAQRIRADQAASLRNRIVELESDIHAITYMAD